MKDQGLAYRALQEMVKQHGGTVQVSSVEGEGSCFSVFIPTGCVHLPAERIRATHTLASTAMGASAYVEEALRWIPQEGNAYSHISTSTSSRILVVDDNADMRDYVKRLLSERWQVETAANGAIALSLIQ